MSSQLQFFLLPFLLFNINSSNADLMRTVYCANKCNDYLKVPEANIPKCEERHLRLNQCGTVISCSWADVELEKQRPVANETIICCYNVILKEKGDCDSQQKLSSSSQQTPRISANSECLAQTPALFTIIVLLILVIAAQTFYILWTCAFHRRLYHQKVCQLEDSTVTHSQGPLIASRPVCEAHLLSFEHLQN